MKNKIQGKINWYDEASGKGSVIANNVWYRINEFTLGAVNLNSGDQVEFELADSSIHPIMIKIAKV